MYFKLFLFSFVLGSSAVNGLLQQGFCSEGYKECEIGNICLLDSHICDGIPSCPDQSDEKYCIGVPSKFLVNNKLVKGYCPEGYVECEKDNVCLEEKFLCDGHFYCPDESDEKYCINKTISTTEIYEVTTQLFKDSTSFFTTNSEETTDQSSNEKEHTFNVPDEADHCKHFKRMITLVRKAHLRLSKLDKRTAKVIENLINEILMEADMENYSSLLELHKVCHNLSKINQTTTTSDPTLV